MSKRQVWFVALVVMTVAAVALPAHAVTLSPLSLTGFNRDVLFGPSDGPGGGFAQGLVPTAGSTWTLFVNGTIDIHGNTAGGLPVGNFSSLTDTAHTYCLAAAGNDSESDNALTLAPNALGALSVTPGYYDTIGVLSIMGAGGNGGAASLVLHYSNGDTSVGLTYASYDYWNGDVNPGTRAVACTTAKGAFNNAGGGPVDNAEIRTDYVNRFYAYESVVAADPTKQLVSIEFTGINPSAPGSDIPHTSVLALSGHAVPEPTSLALLAGGLLGLLAYAWRKRK